MAKAAKTAIKTKDAKAAGAYTFKESIVHKDKIKEFLAAK